MAIAYLDPNGDVTKSGFSTTPSTSDWYTLLDDGVRSPTAPSTASDYLSGAAGGTYEGNLSTVTIDSASAVKLWVYCESTYPGASMARIEVSIKIGGTWQTNQIILDMPVGGPAQAPAWRHWSWTGLSLTQAQLDGLQFRIYATSTASTVRVYAAYAEVTYTPVNQPPTCTLTRKAGDPTARLVRATPTFSDDAGIASAKIVWGDGTETTGIISGTEYSHTYTSAGGVFGMYASATDTGNLTTNSATIINTIAANQPPTVGISVVSIVKRTVTYAISMSDSDGWIQTSPLMAIFNMGNDSGLVPVDGGQYSWTYPAEGGTFTPWLRAYDNEDAESYVELQVVVSPNVAPVCSFTAALSPTDRQTLALNANSSTDPDGAIVEWEFNIGLGWVGMLPGQTAIVSLPGHGMYTVQVRVTDDEGATNTASTIVDATNLPPSLAPTVTMDHRTATVIVNATDSDGTIAAITCDWGDGTDPVSVPLDTQTVTKTYGYRGTYAVTVTATDDDGAVSTATIEATTETVTPSVTLDISVAGRTVTATPTATTGWGNLANLSILWGDGTVSPLCVSGSSVIKTYPDTMIGESAVLRAHAVDDDGMEGWSAVVVASFVPEPSAMVRTLRSLSMQAELFYGGERQYNALHFETWARQAWKSLLMDIRGVFLRRTEIPLTPGVRTYTLPADVKTFLPGGVMLAYLPKAIYSLSQSGDVLTVRTALSHHLSVGMTVAIVGTKGLNTSGFDMDEAVVVSVVDDETFTVARTGANDTGWNGRVEHHEAMTLMQGELVDVVMRPIWTVDSATPRYMVSEGCMTITLDPPPDESMPTLMLTYDALAPDFWNLDATLPTPSEADPAIVDAILVQAYVHAGNARQAALHEEQRQVTLRRVQALMRDRELAAVATEGWES